MRKQNWVVLVIFCLSLFYFSFNSVNVLPSTSKFVTSTSGPVTEIIYPTIDTYISDAEPTTDHGSEKDLKLGVANGYEYAVLLGYDLSNYNDINNMIITVDRVAPAVDFILNPYFITEPWNESVTWTDQPSYDAYDIATALCAADKTSCTVTLSDVILPTPTYGIIFFSSIQNIQTISSREQIPLGQSIITVQISYISKNLDMQITSPSVST